MRLWGWKKISNGIVLDKIFFKSYIYVTIEEKKCKGLTYVFYQIDQFDLENCIMCLKKSQKGWQEWMKLYIDASIHPQKSKTLQKKGNIFNHYHFYFCLWFF
jgi:hypothetical protein